MSQRLSGRASACFQRYNKHVCYRIQAQRFASSSLRVLHAADYATIGLGDNGCSSVQATHASNGVVMGPTLRKS